MKKKIIFLFHGSYNFNWINCIKKILKIIYKNKKYKFNIAFLEFIKPNLFDINFNNYKYIIIIPILFSTGKHINYNLIKLINKIKKKYLIKKIFLLQTISENIKLLKNIIFFFLNQINIFNFLNY